MSAQAKGFTLIELMIVVAVIAILTVVAYPQYQQYTLRSHRANAQQVMMDIAQRQSQILIDSRAYATTVSATGVSIPANVAARYDFALATNSPPPNFTITATPKAGSGQEKDRCGTLTLNNAGAKTASGTGTCW